MSDIGETPEPTSARTEDAPRAVPGRPFRNAWRVATRTASKAWDDTIFAKSATAAFWQTLSLPPLVLALLGSLNYIAGWFGPDTLDIIEARIVSFAETTFSDNVVDTIISPTLDEVLASGHAPVISLGFVLSLWAGSSAIATFVDSIVEAHGQQDARNPIWQRVFALLLYVVFLVVAVFVLPLVALGPAIVGGALPEAWSGVGSQIIDVFYYPGVGLLMILGLTALYKVALHKSLPWHRLLFGALLAGVFFVITSAGLRTYLSWVTGTGYTYGALAAPIAFLLFAFFLGFAVVLGAEFNATIEEFWPARATRLSQVKGWMIDKAADPEASTAIGTISRLATGPISIGPIKREGSTPNPDGTDSTGTESTGTESPPHSPLRRPS